MLNAKQAVEQTQQMLEWRNGEQERLDRVHGYLRGTEPHRWLQSAVPPEVRKLADVSRVNVVSLVVDSVVQSLYVDGYRTPKAGVDVPAWELWQRNGLDARQIGIHRAGVAYGASYVTVLPGDPVSVLRGASPRKMTTVYGQDDDWPLWALEKRRTARGQLYRLFDEEAIYWVGAESADYGDPKLTFISSEIHDAGVVPVVRFRDTDDLDDEIIGEVEPLMPVQDQINLTTFGLLVSQHYGAFRQRYIIGWLAETEEQKLKASAAKLWTFDDHPDDVKVGEFDETDLKGYIESREASLRHLATISQTPVHELTSQLVNLSAEALIAARESHNRKVGERKTVMGEAWEQVLALGGRIEGWETDPAAWVRWKNTDSQSMAQFADALGKMAEMLGIPKRALWERAADALGVSQQELETWEQYADEEDAFSRLTAELERQMGA